MSNWRLSHRFDPDAVAIADRHYSRQSHGTPQFVKPGRCLVLLTDHSLWVTSWQDPQYVKHAWPTWENSWFRREEGETEVASDLIREAIAITRWYWGDPPALGLVTFIDTNEVQGTKVRGEVVYGYSYLKAGFEQVGTTAGGLLAFLLRPSLMPAPMEPQPRDGQMFALRRAS